MFTLAAHVSWFKCEPYDKFREAEKRKFKAIEMLKWFDLDLERAKKEIERTGVEIPAVMVGSDSPQKMQILKESGGIVSQDAHALFLEAFRETVRAARILGARNIVVTTGNEINGMPRARQHGNIVQALRAAAPWAEDAGIQIVLEPLNVLVDHKGYYLSTTAESVEIIREVDSPAVRILYDIYHQQITEGNLIHNIRSNIEYIGHFHAADVPGRHQPGTGEINYRNVFKAIRDTGFDGTVAFECILSEDVDKVCPKVWELLDFD
ncbi:MAG TPA: hydroxypyruvate isomerase [Clostridiales bacterium]|nr:hydroxypyruvate isomerase [Clostridiales bacterium]